MSQFEDIRLYLPKYLSPQSQDKLFAELRQFPANIDKRFYSNYRDSENIIQQGDGLEALLVTDLVSSGLEGAPAIKIAPGPVMVISNTCDIAPDNERFMPARIMYCPVIKLSKYLNGLKRRGVSEDRIAAHIEAIKKQEITSFFYLPQHTKLKEDCIALLDRINNCDSNCVKPDTVKGKKLFSLSNYGFYVFLFKVSMHLSRIKESIDRQ